MALVRVQPVTTTSFTAAASQVGTGIELTLKGNADMAAVEPVRIFLDQVHSAAVTGHAREVIVDLRQVEFMNSSCLKSFVRWLSQLQSLPEAKQYMVRFFPNPTKHWQRASLVALAGFAVDLVKIEGQTA